MFKLFIEGGPLFMGILTIIFLAMLITSVRCFVNLKDGDTKKISLIKSIGLFALVFGVLGQLIGLFSAFSAIEQMKDVSPALLAGGLKVSMITTLYGMIIYAISLIIWISLKWIRK